MALKSLLRVNGETFDQLAGIAGIGWTTSLLGYLMPVIGYSNWFVSRLTTDPQSLLYVGVVCFLATLGLGELATTSPDS